jgi:hypothetical protein
MISNSIDCQLMSTTVHSSKGLLFSKIIMENA